MKPFEWKRTEGRFANGETLWIGRVPVGAWGNPIGRKGESTKYRAEVSLPGLRMKEGTVDFANADEAKRRVEAAVLTWFKWLDG